MAEFSSILVVFSSILVVFSSILVVFSSIQVVFSSILVVFSSILVVFSSIQVVFSSIQVVFSSILVVFSSIQVVFSSIQVVFSSIQVVFSSILVVFSSIQVVFSRFMNGRVPSSKRYRLTDYEHAANCATHGLWIIPSLVGGSVLYFLSVDQWQAAAAWLYGAGLSGLFISSTLFHTVAWKIRHLRGAAFPHATCVTHVAIYFFIAASYTPWLMLRELGPWSSHMRWIIWIMAVIGSTYVYYFHERYHTHTHARTHTRDVTPCRYKLVELLGYVAMGAGPALVILSMADTAGLCELAVGEIFYVVGVAFFKSDGVVPFAHAIWHLFVAMGAATHYYAIWRHLISLSVQLETEIS
uniref:Monocyte to macrophage differentiation associated 2 n=1 Tax=Salmo trutta TaxID=8032 RepID=A0A674DUA7_SALTR